MTYEIFCQTLDLPDPPDLPPLLLALWYDGKNNWEAAHKIAQDEYTREGSLVHAYLHRKEGDLWNAGYWYRQARKTMPQCSLQEEWVQLVRNLL
jgi:hypothetical protein